MQLTFRFSLWYFRFIKPLLEIYENQIRVCLKNEGRERLPARNVYSYNSISLVNKHAPTHGPWPCDTTCVRKGGAKWIVWEVWIQVTFLRRNRTTYAFKGRLKGAKKRGKKGEKMQDSRVDPISGGRKGPVPVALTN